MYSRLFFNFIKEFYFSYDKIIKINKLSFENIVTLKHSREYCNLLFDLFDLLLQYYFKICGCATNRIITRYKCFIDNAYKFNVQYTRQSVKFTYHIIKHNKKNRSRIKQ